MLLPFPPPVIPTSVKAASPGPLTTHPITDSVIGVFIWESLSSNIFTVLITGNACLAHEGQEIILTPLFLKFNDFSISFPILTSFGGSSDKDILIVSPIPSIKSDPSPIEDFMLPDTKLPASVIPKCNG